MTEQADRAQKLVNDPTLQEAFRNVREKYRDLIEATPLSDTEALLDIRKMLHLLNDVESNLHQMIQDGHLEDFRQEQKVRGIDKWLKRMK